VVTGGTPAMRQGAPLYPKPEGFEGAPVRACRRRLAPARQSARVHEGTFDPAPGRPRSGSSAALEASRLTVPCTTPTPGPTVNPDSAAGGSRVTLNHDEQHRRESDHGEGAQVR